MMLHRFRSKREPSNVVISTQQLQIRTGNTSRRQISADQSLLPQQLMTKGRAVLWSSDCCWPNITTAALSYLLHARSSSIFVFLALNCEAIIRDPSAPLIGQTSFFCRQPKNTYGVCDCKFKESLRPFARVNHMDPHDHL